MKPLVSIVMAARDAERSVAACIRSVFHQTYEHWEFIVVDDGSKDATVERIRSFADARIRLYVDNQTRGLAARLNQGIDVARGKYLARMDADDVAYPDRLERQVAFLESHPDIDLLGTGALVFADDGRALGLFPVKCTHEEICARPLSGFYLAHPSWMGRCEWFRSNRYCPTMQRAQDQELLLRTFQRSRFACLPEILIGYRQDRLNLTNILRGRKSFCMALARNALGAYGYIRTVHAVGVQVAKGLVDVIGILSGLERRLLRHRAHPIHLSQIENWERVWITCNATKSPLCVE